jgi:hypothetical protein
MVAAPVIDTGLLSEKENAPGPSSGARSDNDLLLAGSVISSGAAEVNNFALRTPLKRSEKKFAALEKKLEDRRSQSREIHPFRQELANSLADVCLQDKAESHAH